MANPLDGLITAPPSAPANPLDGIATGAPIEQLHLPAPTAPYQFPGSAAYEPTIKSSASMLGIPHDLAMRQVEAESGFHPRAKSKSGALGLMQLMPDTAKSLGVTDPFNPQENIAGGLKYLSTQYHAFGKSWANALAAYNWGPGNVQAWLDRGGGFKYLPEETRNYLQKIVPDEVAKMKAQDRIPMADRGPYGKPRAVVASTNILDGIAAPAPSPSPTAAPNPQAGSAPPDTPPRPSVEAPDYLASAWTGAAHALDYVAGHQDLPYILENALERDNRTSAGIARGHIGYVDALKDPHSYTSEALRMWRANPVAAMDEFGEGSVNHYKWMAEHGDDNQKAIAKFMLRAPVIAGADTAFMEVMNPMSAAEGFGVGKVARGLRWGMETVPWLKNLHISDYLAHGLGPLVGIAKRSGNEGVAWTNSLMSNLAAPHRLLHMDSTHDVVKDVFDFSHHGMTREQAEQAQKDVLLTLDRDDTFFDKVAHAKPGDEIDGVPYDIARRGLALKKDSEEVTKQRLRVGRLKPSQVRRNYFPMKNAYKFDANGSIEEMLHGTGSASSTKQRTFETVAEQLASAHLDPEFSAPRHYTNFREQALRGVAFEDAMARAPRSLRIGPERGLRAKLQTGKLVPRGDGSGREYRTFEGKPYAFAKDPKQFASPAMRKGAVAPELVKFLSNNGALSNFMKAGMTGIEGADKAGKVGTFGRKINGLARTLIVSNFLFHPTNNISGNDAAMRGLRGLGGATWATGGYMRNAAESLARQMGVRDPKAFAGSAEKYNQWLDRALRAGAEAHFPVSRDTPLGGERALLETLPPTTVAGGKGIKGALKGVQTLGKNWTERMDRQLQRAADFNVERTFGEKGEQAFAVSLFKDAIEKGRMSDADAAVLVRETMGNFYNLNPDNALNVLNFFMPWRVGNWRLWSRILVRHPEYVTSVSHPVRNRNIETNEDAVHSQYPPGPFTLVGGYPGTEGTPFAGPRTLPFVGRDASHIYDMTGSATHLDMTGIGSNAEDLAFGSAKPATELLIRGQNSIEAGYNPKDLVGPETSYAFLWNPKAPNPEKFHQFTLSLLSLMPLPAPVLQDSIRRGFEGSDITAGLSEIMGLGYENTNQLTPDQRKEVSRAKTIYTLKWQRYNRDHDEDELSTAWNDYLGALRNAGALH